MPLTAHIPEENFIMGKVNVQVIVEGNELFPGDLIISDNQKGKEMLLDLLSRHSSGLIHLDHSRVKMLH